MTFSEFILSPENTYAWEDLALLVENDKRLGQQGYDFLSLLSDCTTLTQVEDYLTQNHYEEEDPLFAQAEQAWYDYNLYQQKEKKMTEL